MCSGDRNVHATLWQRCGTQLSTLLNWHVQHSQQEEARRLCRPFGSRSALSPWYPAKQECSKRIDRARKSSAPALHRHRTGTAQRCATAPREHRRTGLAQKYHETGAVSAATVVSPAVQEGRQMPTAAQSKSKGFRHTSIDARRRSPCSLSSRPSRSCAEVSNHAAQRSAECAGLRAVSAARERMVPEHCRVCVHTHNRTRISARARVRVSAYVHACLNARARTHACARVFVHTSACRVRVGKHRPGLVEQFQLCSFVPQPAPPNV